MIARPEFLKRIGVSEEAGEWAKWGWWLVSASFLAVFLYRSSLSAIRDMLANPFGAVEQGLVGQWSVLTLCLVWLWVKRRAIDSDIKAHLSRIYPLLGLLSIVASLLVPVPMQLFLGASGLFALFFGRGARIPAILIAIYALPIGFPPIMEHLAEEPYVALTVTSMFTALNALGIAVMQQGQWLFFSDATGNPISVSITFACAGPVTLGVFMSLFWLMLLDTPLPSKSAFILLIVGIIGTTAQSLGRLVILLFLGHHLGVGALWSAHTVSGYILFSLWFAVFCAIYFWFARGAKTRVMGAGSVTSV